MDFEQVIPYLSFLTTWMDKERFPTHETSETKVREDLQQLHNETQQYINTQLIPALVSILDQKAAKSALNDLVAGQVPVDSVKAEHLAPEVREQLNAAAVETAVAQRMADRYTKAESLTAAAKIAFGLSDSATPAGVFDRLSQYAQHCWLKESPVTLELVQAAAPVKLTLADSTESGASNKGSRFYLALSAEADAATRIAVLKNPTSEMRVSYNGVVSGDYAGEYIMFADDPRVYRIDGVGVRKRSYDPGGDAKERVEAYVYAYSVAALPKKTPVEYVFSSSRDAYPDAGDKDGYRYTYLGTPLAKTPTGMRWQIGQYAGAGVCGEEHPNTLELDFVPQAVLFVDTSAGEVHAYLNSFAPASMFTRNGTDLSWHASAVDKQLNKAGVIYGYIAFG